MSRQEAEISSGWNLVQEQEESSEILECELGVMF